VFPSWNWDTNTWQHIASQEGCGFAPHQPAPYTFGGGNQGPPVGCGSVQHLAPSSLEVSAPFLPLPSAQLWESMPCLHIRALAMPPTHCAAVVESLPALLLWRHNWLKTLNPSCKNILLSKTLLGQLFRFIH